MKSTQAQTAKAIRKELKEKYPNFKFTVRSESASMMTAVNIHWVDGPTIKQVDEIADKYQYGHFDGMTDCYEYSNRRKDLPQVKYISTSREMSLEVKEHFKRTLNPVTNNGYDWEVSEAIYREFYQTAIG